MCSGASSISAQTLGYTLDANNKRYLRTQEFKKVYCMLKLYLI